MVVCNHFLKPLSGRYFRIYPMTWRSWISMRVEFYGCITGKFVKRKKTTPAGLCRERFCTKSFSALILAVRKFEREQKTIDEAGVDRASTTTPYLVEALFSLQFRAVGMRKKHLVGLSPPVRAVTLATQNKPTLYLLFLPNPLLLYLT